MKIGIHASNSRYGGGQFQFLVMFLDALFMDDIEHEFYLLYFDDKGGLSKRYRKERWHWIDLGKELQSLKLEERKHKLIGVFVIRLLSFFKKVLKKLLWYVGVAAISRRKAIKKDDYDLKDMQRLKKALIHSYKLDCIFFPIWTDYCWEWGVPFVFTIHDLQHRLQPEFCEVSLNNGWASRDKFFSNAISRAKIVLVDSEEGGRNVLQFYDCEPEKISVLPYTIPSSSIVQVTDELRSEIIEKMGIQQRFFFYPAQFWPHKNHYRIVEAIGLLKKRHHVKIPVVFVGHTYSEWDVLSMCKALAKMYLVEDQIYYFRYVNDEKLVALYNTAVGLVMPTYFGPSNIPYLEAFYHKCPVIASDIPGIREQVGDAALLVNPKDAEAISEAMYRIWTDESLRESLIKKGQERLKEFSPERFKKRLVSVIDNLSRMGSR